LTGLYAPAGIRRATIRGEVAGELVVGGVVNRGETAIAGDIDVEGHVRRILSFGDVTGDISAGNGLRSLCVRSDLAGDVNVEGDVRSVTVRGNLTGTLTTTPHDGQAGDLNRLLVRRGHLADSGQISLSGGLNFVKVFNPGAAAIEGDVEAGGRIGRILSVGDVWGDVSAGDGLGLLHCRGMLTGDVDVTGDLRRLTVVNPRGNAILGSTIGVDAGGIGRLATVGSVTESDISASARINLVSVRGDFTDSAIEALALRRVRVMRAISDPTTAEPDVIHALLPESWFTLIEGRHRETISVDNNHVDFGGVDAFVG